MLDGCGAYAVMVFGAETKIVLFSKVQCSSRDQNNTWIVMQILHNYVNKI